MDFIGGALPNVMFLIGVIAIGIGLGLEFKIIEVKNGLSRGGRVGACLVGIALVATSIALYLRPTQTASGPSPAVAVAAGAASDTSSSQVAPTNAPPSAPTSEPTPLPTDAPTSEPTPLPPSAPTSESTPLPTDAPTSTPTSAPTALPTVEMPDIRDMSQKDAEKLLAQVGLVLGDEAASCEELGVAEELRAEARKGRIACQSVEPGSSVPEGSLVAYALSNGKD